MQLWVMESITISVYERKWSTETLVIVLLSLSESSVALDLTMIDKTYSWTSTVAANKKLSFRFISTIVERWQNENETVAERYG
jgi:hypothetical protein